VRRPSRREPDLARSSSSTARAPSGRRPSPELELHLADDMEHAWADLQDELDDATLPPPFWAFAWLGGQAVARYVLDAPAEVAGRSVLDLATGSGPVRPRRRAGRARRASRASTSTPVAVVGGPAQRRAQRLEVVTAVRDVLDGPAPDVDVVLAGDVFYDAAMAERVQPWLLEAHRTGPRAARRPRPALPAEGAADELAAYDLVTTRELEGVLVKTTRVYALGA
jgi:predicted nicotinamide N-methyase